MAESLKKVRKAKSAGNLLSAILDLGKAMITCGGEVWRVEETLGMMFDTYCFKEYDIIVMSNGIHATAKTWDGRIYTQVRQLEGTSYDLDKLERLFSLANEIEEKPLGVDHLKERLYEILESPGIPLWRGLIGSIIAACGFCDGIDNTSDGADWSGASSGADYHRDYAPFDQRTGLYQRIQGPHSWRCSVGNY